jgi:FkbM family methyltransferase
MARAGRRAVEYVMGKLGYTIIPTWRMERYEQSQYLIRLFRLLDIDCVLDVGANLGQYRDFLRNEIGYSGTIISYEPIPAHVEALRTRADGENNWLIEGYALGSERKTATFNVMSSTAFSSFLTPDHTSVGRFGSTNVVQQHVTVDMLTLDESIARLVDRLGPRHVYMKLDTQGFDLEVAKGATETLKLVRALQTEVSFKPIYLGMPDYMTAIRTFEMLGFEVSGLFKNNEGHFPELIELDCHMISKKYIAP